MMKSSRQILSIILAMLIVGMTSCGGAAGGNDTTATDDSVTTEPEVTTGRYDTGLPDRNFDGYDFTFAVRGIEGDPYQWNNTDIVAESENGDVINDSVFRRNAYMRDKYGVNINVLFAGNTGVSTTGSEMYQFINKSIMSGDSEFDAILSSPFDSIGYVISDFVVDLNTVENLNLSREWWDQNAMKNLVFGGKTYITTGDVTIIDNKATHAYVFNKQLVEDLKLDDPYEVVKSGKWTIDKLAADSKLATADLNGDSVMDENDRYGFWYWQDAAFTFITSSGNAFGRVNSKGQPELTLNTERMVNTWEKVNKLITSGYTFGGVPGDPEEKSQLKMFGSNQALYSWACVADIIKMRNLDVEFGIIPAPKYDEEQENYITSPHAYGNTLMTVPVTCSDTERAGFILEAYTAKTAELVTPAFYEVTLKGKTTRDDESLEMLDLIFANKFYDIGYFFMWGDYTNKLMEAFNAKDPNFASLYKESEAIALEDIAKIADKFN